MFSCEYCEISKNTYLEEHLRTAISEVTLGSNCLGLSFFLPRRFQNHPDSVILQKYQLLSNKSFKQNSAHMSSLNLTLKLSFEPRFRMFISYIYYAKSKRL